MPVDTCKTIGKRVILIYFCSTMGLENDIQQATFKTEQQKALVNLIYTYHWSTEKLRAIFDNEDITMQQFNILRILRGAGKPISTLQIRQRMLDKMSDTSRIVDRLISKELVHKNICSTDKRLVDVNITTKGKAVLKKLDAYETQMNGLLQNLSNDEMKTLNQLLDKIRVEKTG